MQNSNNNHDNNMRFSGRTMPKKDFGPTVIELDGVDEGSDNETGIGSSDWSNLSERNGSNGDTNETFRNIDIERSQENLQVYNISLTDPTNFDDGQISNRIHPVNDNIPRSDKQMKNAKSAEIGPNVFDDYYRKDSVPDIRFKYDEFVSRITCHGIQDWHGAHSKPSFVFWGVIFLVATVVLIYSIYKCLNDFYTEPINTSISVNPLSSIPFPDVYICPTSFLNDTKFNNLDSKAQQRAAFFTARTENSGGLLQLQKVVSDQFPHGASGMGGVSWPPPPPPPKLVKQQQVIVSASLDIGSFIPECQFTGTNVAKHKESDYDGASSDCRHLIERKLDIDYGVCYLIRLSKTGRQSTPGKGLSVVVDLLTEITFPQTQQDMFSAGSLSDGIYVAIQSEYHPVNYQRILVSPGTHTQISLQAKEETFVSISSFSKTPQLCVEDGEVEFAILNVTYTREACLFDCVQQAVFQNSEMGYKCLLPVDVWSVKQEHWNITNWCRDYELLKSIKSANYTKCAAKCHRACHEKSYIVATSNHKIPSRYFREKMLFHQSYADAAAQAGDNSANQNFQSTQVTHPDTTHRDFPRGTENATNNGIPENDANTIDFATTVFQASQGSPLVGNSGNPGVSTIGPPASFNPDWKTDVPPQQPLEYSSSYSPLMPTPSRDVDVAEPPLDADYGVTNQQFEGENSKSLLFNISRWEQNVIVLEVSFDKLEVTSVTQSKAMTVMSLLGNLGGVSGLWLGASLFTVLQCIVFALKLCFSFCYTKKT